MAGTCLRSRCVETALVYFLNSLSLHSTVYCDTDKKLPNPGRRTSILAFHIIISFFSNIVERLYLVFLLAVHYK
jgi:hypothetical protein